MDLVDDDRRGIAQQGAAALGGEQDVERFGRGDEDVRRVFDLQRALARRRVAAAYGDADVGQRGAARLGGGEDAGERRLQVLLDVVAERLEGRYVDGVDTVLESAVEAALDEIVERPQKRGERLAGTGRRGDQRVEAGGDVPPSF